MNAPVTLPEQPETSSRTIEPGTPLHAGTVVYRVIEDDLPPHVQGPHSWKVGAVVVERASPRQIKLKRPFPGLANKVFEPTALGRAFFETPQQAIETFLAERRRESEGLFHRTKEVERAIAWALHQEGLSQPQDKTLVPEHAAQQPSHE